MDEWPPVTVKRFAGESRLAYERRAARIEEIVRGFRIGSYQGKLGDEMERLLIELRTARRERAVA